jgi:hypothetical protein
MKKYRFLKPGEKVKVGDEIYGPFADRWSKQGSKSYFIGCKVGKNSNPVRRKTNNETTI